MCSWYEFQMNDDFPFVGILFQKSSEIYTCIFEKNIENHLKLLKIQRVHNDLGILDSISLGMQRLQEGKGDHRERSGLFAKKSTRSYNYKS